MPKRHHLPADTKLLPPKKKIKSTTSNPLEAKQIWLRNQLKELEKIDISTLRAQQQKNHERKKQRYIRELEVIDAEITGISPATLIETPSLNDLEMMHHHNLAIAAFTAANDVLIIWRPINSEAAERLERAQDPYMGKGLNTKGKSSEFGPIAGDIPCMAGLSKVAISAPEQEGKFQKENDQCLSQDAARYNQIKPALNTDNIDKYNDELLVCKVPKKDSRGRQIYYVVDEQQKMVWDEAHLSPLFVTPHSKKKENIFFMIIKLKPFQRRCFL
jgi:hypothetical protein